MTRGSARLVAALLGAALASPRAQADGPERWLLIPALAEEPSKELAPAALTEPLETELRGAGRSLVPNRRAAELFEARHSFDPVHLDGDQVRRLSQAIATAARHLALGELAEAQRAMRSVQALSAGARDALNRDGGRARKIFDNCLMAAYLLSRSQQQAPALQQMLECMEDYPGFRPEGRAYPPSVQALFEQASRELEQRGRSSLRVSSPGRSGCSVRLNGLHAGQSPLLLAAIRGGATRVQLECEPGVPGRIHRLEITPGDHELAIDPAFEAAVRSRGALWLAYPSERERDARAEHDAAAIGRLLGVERVVLLWNQAGAIGHDIAARPAAAGSSELARASYAADDGYASGGAKKLASALLAWAGGPTRATATSAPAGPIDDPTLRGVEPAATASTTALPPTAAARYTQQHATAGAILAIVGGASAAVSWGMYAARQPKRTVVADAGDATSYKRLGVLALSTGIVGMSLVSFSEYFWLPDHPTVPPLAWVAGAFGFSIGVVAATLWLTEADCGFGDDRVSCQRLWADRHFGPLLFVHALPLMSVPLWYGLRLAFRPSHLQLTLGPGVDGAPQLQVRGTL